MSYNLCIKLFLYALNIFNFKFIFVYHIIWSASTDTELFKMQSRDVSFR